MTPPLDLDALKPRYIAMERIGSHADREEANRILALIAEVESLRMALRGTVEHLHQLYRDIPHNDHLREEAECVHIAFARVCGVLGLDMKTGVAQPKETP